MHALACEVVRAFTKLGIAIAASKPMMATTIIISTSVNPDLFDVLIFILLLLFVLLRRELRNRRVNIMTLLVHGLPVTSAGREISTWDAKPLQEEKRPEV